MPDCLASKDRISLFRKGELLFKENDNSQDFFIIKSGSVRVFKKMGQKEVTLDTLGPGMVAGEIASIDNVVRTASGIALSDTEVIVIPRSSVEKILEKIPEWFRKISQILVQRLSEVDEKISRALKSDYTNYVAAIIAMVSYSEKAAKKAEGPEIDQKFLEYEVMDLLAIPLAEVQSALEKLAAEQVVRVQGGKVILINREACEKMAVEATA
jgi:CRP/FNR family transcriptional regulator, cyclic AMP receptor protein